MIRKAVARDLLKIEGILSEFYNSEGFQTLGVPYDRDSILEVSLTMMLSKEAFMLVSEKNGHVGGVIGARKMPLPYNKNYFSLIETFWYSKDGSGVSLLRGIEKIAISNGIKLVGIVTIHGMKSEKIIRVLSKIGYRRLENHLVKEL